MKKKLLLFLGFVALSLSACNAGNTPSVSSEESNSNNSSEAQQVNKYAEALKVCASSIMQINNPSTSNAVKMAFQPADPAAGNLATPAVYLYWAGLIEEIDGVSIVGQAIRSSGTYRFKGMGGQIQDITFDLSVDFDEANGKFLFLGRQNIPAPSPVAHSYMIMECKYDFTTKQFGGFSSFMQPEDNSYGYWMRYYDNIFEMYNYNAMDAHATDESYVEYRPFVESKIAVIDSRIPNEPELTESQHQATRLAFVGASDYYDALAGGVGFNVEIVDA